MNTLFTVKARVIILSLLICQVALKVQGSTITRLNSNTDTTLVKKVDTAQHLVKADTALIVRAGATIVTKSDTTFVIHGAADKTADKIPAVKTDSATIAKSDPATTVVVVAPKPDAATALSAGAAKPDTAVAAATGAAATKGNTIIAQPIDGIIQVRGTATAPPTDGLIEIRNGMGEMRVRNTGDSTHTAAPKKDDVGATNISSADKTADAAVTPAKADAATIAPVVKDTTAKKTDPALTASPDTTKKIDTTKKADTTKKIDTTLSKKADTTAKKVDTLAKKADSLAKKSDTTLVKKDSTDEITEIKAQNVYLEVGGAGIAISANYDTRFNKSRSGWGYRVGAGFFSSGGNTVFTVPFQVNYLIGAHSHMFELGAGTTFLNSTGNSGGNSKWQFDNITGFVATATIGYRFQPAHKGINFRLAFTPILYDEGIIPAGGVSIGYTFK